MKSFANNDDKYLIVLTGLGLCNRLISLANYGAIAKSTNRILKINWPLDAAVCDTNLGEVYTDEIEISKRQLKYIVKNYDHDYLDVNYGITGKDKRDADLINNIPKLSQRFLIVTLSCYFEPSFLNRIDFHHQTRKYLLDLKLRSTLLKTINSFCEYHEIDPDNPKIMGLHIRRTDGQRDTQYSTDSQFMDVIERELNCDAETKFFLATDCLLTQQKFLKRYREAVFIYPKNFTNNSVRTSNLQDAVIELYILSKTHYIYGSYGSSFSKVASIIRGCKFHQTGLV